jgi:hypothetical protein
VGAGAAAACAAAGSGDGERVRSRQPPEWSCRVRSTTTLSGGLGPCPHDSQCTVHKGLRQALCAQDLARGSPQCGIAHTVRAALAASGAEAACEAAPDRWDDSPARAEPGNTPLAARCRKAVRASRSPASSASICSWLTAPPWAALGPAAEGPLGWRLGCRGDAVSARPGCGPPLPASAALLRWTHNLRAPSVGKSGGSVPLATSWSRAAVHNSDSRVGLHSTDVIVSSPNWQTQSTHGRTHKPSQLKQLSSGKKARGRQTCCLGAARAAGGSCGGQASSWPVLCHSR